MKILKQEKSILKLFFRYKQKDDLITANYYGGTIKHGKIIAHLQDNKLNMLYQCLTTENQLKAGKAMAIISLNPENKIKLKLNWQWLNDEKEQGISEYIEN